MTESWFAQPDLLGGEHPDPAGLEVGAPIASPAVVWERLPQAPQHACAHCQLIAGQALRERRASPHIRTATWRRYGRYGCVTLLCTGHRGLQHRRDGEPGAE